MIVEKHIEDKILDALLKIVAKHRADNLVKVDEHNVFAEAMTVTQTADHDGKYKEDYSDNWSKLILKPVLDANLLELLRLALQGNQAAISTLTEKLTDISFDHAKRLAVVEILAKAFERGNKAADRILEKTMPRLEEKGLSSIKKDVQEAITKTSEYTAQYFEIIKPTFNPRPRLYKEPSDDDKGNVW